MDRHGRLGRALASLGVVLTLAGLALTACDSPPQIIDIQPERGAADIRSSEPVQVRFDRAVDEASVAERFQVTPYVKGQISWDSSSTLVFKHDSFAPDTSYRVSLDAGYRDQQGVANPLRHSWTFTTELPPALRGTVPGEGEHDVDPAAYLLITYSREMDAATFAGVVSFSPEVSYAVRVDPTDARRVVIAPRFVLDPGTRYEVSVSGDARDVDGNRAPPFKLSFYTGAARPLNRWITFVAASAAGQPGSDVWMVDEIGFPRKLAEGPADGFTISPDGTHLLIEHPNQGWTDYETGGGTADLPFQAVWAAWLGPGQGYAYLDRAGHLMRLLSDGSQRTVSAGVLEVALAPTLTRLAFVVAGAAGDEIRGYDLSLRSQYRIQLETGRVRDLRWSPAANSIAYLVGVLPRELRVKSLTGNGQAITVATGELAAPAWLGDSGDLVFQAAVDLKGLHRWRIYRVGAGAGTPLVPTPAGFLGGALETDMTSPTASADGHQIAFLAGAAASAQVWLMNADGTGMHRLTAYDASTFPFACADLHWAG